MEEAGQRQDVVQGAGLLPPDQLHQAEVGHVLRCQDGMNKIYRITTGERKAFPGFRSER
jgi:hypothetical protein